MELLLGMSVVNAHILHKKATGKKINIAEFRESVTSAFLENVHSNQQEREKVFLILKRRLKNDVPNSLPCKLCYKKIKLSVKAKKK